MRSFFSRLPGLTLLFLKGNTHFLRKTKSIMFYLIWIIALFSSVQLFSTLVLSNILQHATQSVVANDSLHNQQAIMDKARMELLIASDKLNRAGIYFMQDKETGSDGSWHSLMQESLSALEASHQAFLQFSQLSVATSPEMGQAQQELKDAYQSFYQGLQEQAAGLQSKNSIDVFFEVPIQAFESDFSDKYYAYLKVNDEITRLGSEQLLRSLSLTTKLFIAALAVVAFISLAVWLVARRKIINPLKQLIANINILANGDLSQTLTVSHSPVIEVQQLSYSLQNMQQGLRQLVSEVRSASEQIYQGVNQIAQRNETLSQQAETQNEELQHAATHINELNQKVKDNTEHAELASSRAAQAKEVAVNGGDIMQQVELSMKVIVDQSSEMSSIVALIDSVAFQTNILALNAAIEAAHAGQSGRGFAVVAKEIGLLAQKSSHSTQGIHQLINKSMEQVSAGSGSVQILSRCLREIISLFSGLSSLVTEISQASHTQRESLDEVSERISALHRVTEQNSQLAGLTASGSVQLLQHSQQLERAVASFLLAGPEQIA
jgi:methyl-accepting chemotaxis protein-1 (serine sensor receptor)